jgi:hypothetical protein
MNVKIAFIPLFLLASCGSSGVSQKVTCKSSPDLNKTDKFRITPEWRKMSALHAIRDLRELRSLAQTSWFGTGVFSESLGNIAGTDSYNLKSKVRSVQSQVADIKAVDFSLETGGKNPLPSNAEWACKMLAVSVGNLDTGQSDEQFLWMVSSAENYLTRTYQASGGLDLKSDLLALEAGGVMK